MVVRRGLPFCLNVGEMSDEFPKGWVTAPLAQIAEINLRHSKEFDDSMPISFARMTGLSESKPESDSTSQLNRAIQIEDGRHRHLYDGDEIQKRLRAALAYP